MVPDDIIIDLENMPDWWITLITHYETKEVATPDGSVNIPVSFNLMSRSGRYLTVNQWKDEGNLIKPKQDQKRRGTSLKVTVEFHSDGLNSKEEYFYQLLAEEYFDELAKRLREMRVAEQQKADSKRPAMEKHINGLE